MKTIISLLIVLAVSASAQPKYYGKFFWDGGGLTNVNANQLGFLYKYSDGADQVGFRAGVSGDPESYFYYDGTYFNSGSNAITPFKASAFYGNAMGLTNLQAIAISGTITNPISTSTMTVGTLNASNLVYIGNNLSLWSGPSNTLTLGNSPFTTHYVWPVLNTNVAIVAVTAVTGHTNAGEWTTTLSLTNGYSSNYSIVLPGDWHIYGEANTNWVTLTNGTALRLAILSSTNIYNNKTNAWISWRHK